LGILGVLIISIFVAQLLKLISTNVTKLTDMSIHFLDFDMSNLAYLKGQSLSTLCPTLKVLL